MYPCAQVFYSSFITTLDRTFKVHSNYSCSFIYHTIYITEKYEVSGYPRSLPTTNNAATPITISLSCVRQEVLIVLTYNSTNYNSMQSSESSSSTWWGIHLSVAICPLIRWFFNYVCAMCLSLKAWGVSTPQVVVFVVRSSTDQRSARVQSVDGGWGGRIIIIVSTSL